MSSDIKSKATSFILYFLRFASDPVLRDSSHLMFPDSSPSSLTNFLNHLPHFKWLSKSSGSTSASATAAIFQSQTILFLQFGNTHTHLLFCISFMEPRLPPSPKKRLQSLRAVRLMRRALGFFPRQRMYQTRLPLQPPRCINDSHAS